MIECKVYKFKEEFCKELGIPNNQPDRRLKELLEWLKNFYDFNFFKGNPHRIEILEVIGEYRPLPRKVPRQDQLTLEKKEKYKEFTIKSLDKEFTPNSKSRVARKAIEKFGYPDYGHNSIRSVVNRYIKKPFDEYGESDNNWIWVYFRSYKPLEGEALNRWRQILAVEKIDEGRAACAFYKLAEGESIEEELNFYLRAKEKFMDEYNDFPIRVQSWRLKREEEENN